MNSCEYLVIGGGFFGCYVASKLKQLHPLKEVTLVERERLLLSRASLRNQARIHRGYHYPRSLMTGLRSRVNYSRFVETFPEAVFDDFTSVYAVAAQNSKVSAAQFARFCDLIEAPLKQAPDSIRYLFASDFVEEVFLVEEKVFNAVRLREYFQEELESYGVNVLTESNVISLTHEQAFWNVKLTRKMDSQETMRTNTVFNCTYAAINDLRRTAKLPLVHLKQEFTETPLAILPDSLKNLGITIMCGPFFSIMPYPTESLHSIHHVRYTPHQEWFDREYDFSNQDYFEGAPRESRWNHMLKDIIRYIPSMESAQHRGALWEVKTILPASEIDDSRPILFFKDQGEHKNSYSILGGKIDNVFELDDALESLR